MKYSLSILFYLMVVIIDSYSQCSYSTNKIDEFDKIVIKELERFEIKQSNDIQKSVWITMIRKGNEKFIEFSNYYYEVSIGRCIAKVKLENGTIIIFKNRADIQSNRINVKGKLLPMEINELKKSPIDLIRFEITNISDEKEIIDYKVAPNEKQYFIDNLDCLN